jgi:hypothetical protein
VCRTRGWGKAGPRGIAGFSWGMDHFAGHDGLRHQFVGNTGTGAGAAGTTLNAEAGLRSGCRLMVDKITTVPKANLGTRIGRLGSDDMVRLTRGMLASVGIA